MSKLVKFLKTCSPYQTGETAGFTDAYADRLVKSGAAEAVEEKRPEPEKGYKAPADKMVRPDAAVTK